MRVVSRWLVDLVARYRIHRLRRRLQSEGRDAPAQAATLRRLLRGFEKTDLGRQHKLHGKLSYDAFRRQVPLRWSGDFQAFSERMAGGTRDVLWPGTCDHYVYTAGTVDGAPKMLPLTPDLVAHFRYSLRTAWLMHAARVDRSTVFHGAHVQTGASTALVTGSGVRAGFVDGAIRMALTGWARDSLCAPASEISDLPEGPDKTARTVADCTGRDVRLLSGTPGAMISLLSAAKEAGVRWPHLECCVHTGVMLGIQEKPLAENLGPQVSLHEVYLAAEGFFAAQDGESDRGLRLLTDAGIFFEFLPLHEASGDLTQAGGRCVPLEGVRPETEYALVVTTPGGLCRCLVGDTVRFVSVHPPRVLVTGRTQTRLNSFGEQVSERDLVDALLEVCVRSQWEAVQFHVAPYFSRIVPRPQGCHEWWVELRPGTVRTPTGPVLGEELDIELIRRNRGYAARRRSGAVEPPVVRLVMPGVFSRWSELHPTFGGPGKFARCRNDRIMADQLAAIAKFHPGTTPPFSHGS